MKLSDIKKRLSKVEPFLTHQLYGINQVLAMPTKDGYVPLSVVVNPPSMAFIVESGFITSLITRYSKTYTEGLRKEGGIKLDKSEAINKMMDEVKEGLFSSEDEQAKQLGLITKLGKAYLMAKAVRAYYGDEKDSFKISFSDNKQEVDEGNKDTGDEHLYVLVDVIDDLELVRIGSELVSALPTSDIANIPFADSTPDAEDGELVEEVTASAPADKVSSFRRNLRGVTVEDVPPSGGTEVGDSGGNPTI